MLMKKILRFPQKETTFRSSFSKSHNLHNNNVPTTFLKSENDEQPDKTIENNVNSCSSNTYEVERNHFMRSVINEIISKNVINTQEKNVVIDFSSPNIAKPFHVGHLRSTIIGNFIANINNYFHNKVTKINYLGDWGTQFGILQYGLKDRNIDINQLKKDPMKVLFDCYVYANQKASTSSVVRDEARQYFADIEQGKCSLDSWLAMRKITVEELQKVYQRLGITFDEYHWESDYNTSAIKGVIELLERNNIIKADETGRKFVKVRDRNVPILKSDNSTLYLSRDVAALLDRYNKYKFDEMLYVVDNSQSDHFYAVFDVIKQINEECFHRCKHIKFGRIQSMSTRSGNVVFLNDILDEAKQKMYEKQQKSKNTRSSAMDEKTCDILGTTAVIINDLKQRRQRDYLFDWDKVLQSEGDSGIKLQYLHCRLMSLEKNCGMSLPEKFEPNTLPEPVVSDVIAELAKFENMLLRAKTEYEASIVVSYLFRLAKNVNRMFKELNVKNVTPDIGSQRLLVFHSARLVVKTGLEILGVQPLDEM